MIITNPSNPSQTFDTDAPRTRGRPSRWLVEHPDYIIFKGARKNIVDKANNVEPIPLPMFVGRTLFLEPGTSVTDVDNWLNEHSIVIKDNTTTPDQIIVRLPTTSLPILRQTPGYIKDEHYEPPKLVPDASKEVLFDYGDDPPSPNFVELCVRGEELIENHWDYIQKFHSAENRFHGPMWVYLGMTETEFQQWNKDESKIYDIVARRKFQEA